MNTRQTRPVQVMIVALPGAWQQILQKNIETYPFVQVVQVASGGLSAAELAREAAPDLMIIDSSIPFDDATALVRHVKLQNPAIRLMVLTDTSQQRHKIALTGADYALTSYSYETQIGPILGRLSQSIQSV